MRIRKNNARLISPASSRPYIICELNRSPWDVDDATFSLLHQDNNARSLGLADSHPPSDSHESMELSLEKKPSSLVKHEMMLEDDEEIDPGLQAAIGLSALKRDNNTLCDELKNQLWFKPPQQMMAKKTPSHVAAQKKRGRPKKPRASLAGTGAGADNSNPYEFYYYSGFGPRWGKRRGGGNSEEENNAAAAAGGGSVDGSSSTSQAMSEDDNDDNNNNVRGDYDNDNGGDDDNCKEKDNGVYMVEGEGKRELDYLEDDDDEDEEGSCGGGGGGRRVRKPIKARSLKSLM